MCQSLKADGLDDSEVSMLAGVLREKQTFFFISELCIPGYSTFKKNNAKEDQQMCSHFLSPLCIGEYKQEVELLNAFDNCQTYLRSVISGR